MRNLLIVTIFIFSLPAYSATTKAKLPKPLKVAQANSSKVESEFDPKDYIDETEEDEEEVVDDEPDEEELTPAPVTPAKKLQADVTPESPEKPSSSSGYKIFDWTKHQDKREVPHPYAEKGLTRITKEGDYLYKVDESKQNRASSFRVGIFNPTNLENPDQAGQAGSTFEDNYDQTNNPAIMFDYEWQLWRMSVGKLGVRAGTGAYIAQGNGHFVSTTNQGLTPREIFTFWAMPNTLGLVYRAHVWDRQLLVPYAEGGGIVFAFGEFRDDEKPPKWGGALAGYFAGGVALNLTYFDALSRAQLDREYGINRVYLTAEYRQIIAITQTYDFTSDLVNAGFLMEF